MTELTITDTDHHGADGRLDFPERTLRVRFTRRSFGGWDVNRADNGRVLGWLVKGSDGYWEAHVAQSAFRGTGVDDTGDALDKVPGDLYFAVNGNSLTAAAMGYGTTREDAASELFWHLYRKHAPAASIRGTAEFGAHYAVTAHVSR